MCTVRSCETEGALQNQRPSGSFRFRLVLLMWCVLAGCVRQVPITDPTEGQKIGYIRLCSGEEIHIEPPETAQWQYGSVIVRSSNGDLRQVYASEDIAEVANKEVDPAGAVAVVALTVGVLVALLVSGLSDANSGL